MSKFTREFKKAQFSIDDNKFIITPNNTFLRRRSFENGVYEDVTTYFPYPEAESTAERLAVITGVPYTKSQDKENQPISYIFESSGPVNAILVRQILLASVVRNLITMGESREFLLAFKAHDESVRNLLVEPSEDKESLPRPFFSKVDQGRFGDTITVSSVDLRLG